MAQSRPPARTPLYAPLESRAGNLLKDSALYNGYVEKGGEQGMVDVYKRPGVSLKAAVAVGAGQGVFNWNGNIYSVFAGQLYKDGVAKGAVDATSIYTFTSVLGSTPKLFLKNEVAAYSYDDGGGLVHVTDVDYPATTVKGCAYLDGGVYVLDSTSRVVGSAINDPQTWDPLNFLYVQIEPDPPQALAKQLVYVIAIKSISTEVFYDAGNGTGSPLGPVQGSKLGVGCRTPGSVCRLGDDLAWVGTTTEGDVQVMFMSKVHGESISTPSVEKLLATLDYTTTWSWSAKVAGHRFYVVTVVAANLSLVFDLTAGAWYIWTDTAGNYLPYVSSTYDSNGRVILQHATNGNLYYLLAANYGDSGVAIPFTLYTPNFDGSVHTAKSMARTEIIADRVATNVNISWSDDDYQTFSSPVTVNLDQTRPYFQDGSSFSSRSYKITHTDNTFLRLYSLEMVIDVGTS